MDREILKLDAEFSIYVRASRADFQGFVTCYTCPARYHWKAMQCGHFRKRADFATRFHEDNCRPQCANCNETLGGNLEVFEEELRDEIGDERVDNLIELSKSYSGEDTAYYVDKLAYYRSKNKELGV